MFVFTLAFKSLRNRKFTVGLTVLSIALSVMLLLGVERIRRETKASFTNSISGTDLIVGARSGAIQLLLYSVFRIGNATNNISWQSAEEIARHPEVAWTIPISLGDSHQGYRVMGTTTDYFEHFRVGRDRPLELAEGQRFDDVYDAVLGAEVAAALNYDIDDQIVIAHGAGRVSLIEHADKPFRVAGILQPTGTPVDRTVHVSLEGIEAIHIDWQDGAPPVPGLGISAERARRLRLQPTQVTAVLVGMNSRISTFAVQRFVNDYPQEALLAIIPGVALQELWDLMGVAERGLLAISGLVVLVGLSGMLTALLTSSNERRREMAILRSVGARPLHVFALIVGEAGVVTVMGLATGIVLLYSSLFVARPLIASRLGLYLEIGGLSKYELALMGIVCVAGVSIGFIPGYRSYHYSLADGMTIRL
ncbi:MAG: ABC transporter permease [Cyanobacteria bacterium P01_D01_bin.123]